MLNMSSAKKQMKIDAVFTGFLYVPFFTPPFNYSYSVRSNFCCCWIMLFCRCEHSSCAMWLSIVHYSQFFSLSFSVFFFFGLYLRYLSLTLSLSDDGGLQRSTWSQCLLKRHGPHHAWSLTIICIIVTVIAEIVPIGGEQTFNFFFSFISFIESTWWSKQLDQPNTHFLLANASIELIELFPGNFLFLSLPLALQTPRLHKSTHI